MRVVRRVVALLLLPLVLLTATVIGTFAAVVLTPPGHALLARIATTWISRATVGRVEIGAIEGNLWNHVELDDVVIRDQRGAVIVSTPRLAASYVLPELLARRLVFHNVQADSLVLHLVRLRAGRWNYEEVFHLGEGPGSGKPPMHVAFTNFRVTDASLQIDVPTTPGPPHRPASRHARAPAQPRIERGIDGPVRVYTATDLSATFRLLRISTPRHDPLLADIATLHATLSDPQLTITQMAGQIIAAADTLRFRFDSAGLPSSRLVGGGAVRWPHDSILFDFALDLPRVALRDLWWIQPDFPDWSGKGHVIAKSINGSRTDYKLDNLVLGSGNAGISGNVTVVTDNARGLGMRGLNLQLRHAPINLLQPYLDTLPVSGALTGHLRADGFLDSLQLDGDLMFADALVAGAPASRLRVDGVMHLGGADGAVFQQFQLNHTALALGTVHRLVPSVLIPGELRLTGELDGPWKNAHFLGTVEHAAPDSSLSRLIGSVRLDTRGPVLGVAVDADLDQLSFDALRTGYPALTVRGGLTGHLVANGDLDSLDLDANLTGEIGSVHAIGRVTVNAPHYGADSLILDMQRLDVSAVLGQGASTALNGRATVRGTMDSGVPPQGSVHLALDRSRFGGATVDAVTGVVRAAHGMVLVDTGAVVWSAGRVNAQGTLGWAAPDSGMLTLQATATSLAPFDSLVRAATGLTSDTLHPHVLDGHAHAALVVTGSLDAATVTGTVRGTQLVLDDWHAGAIDASLRADSLGRRELRVDATVDTVGRGDHVADHVQLHITGKPDSLRVAGTLAMVALGASGGGTLRRNANADQVQLDSLALNFPHQRWRLAKSVRVTMTAGQFFLADTLRLQSTDGSGEIRVSGATPGATAGQLDASVKGLDLLDVFGVLQRDTTAMDGWGSIDLHLAGTRDAPIIKGTASVTGPVMGAVHVPSVQATFDYAAQRLRSDVSLWKTGRKVLDGNVSLPLDLALASRTTRKLGGPLEITGVADSVDMVILAALIPSISNPTGVFSLNLKGSGTWDAPQLEGLLTIHDAGMTLPSLGVRYGPINGRARFVADSLVFDSLLIQSADGQVNVKGGMRFARLAEPTMDLHMSARSFLAIDAPSFLTLRATGNVRMAGPLWHPVLTGDGVTLSRSVIYFADLITKNVVDLEDPENAALVDTMALRRQGLGNEFSNRFLDSLRIAGLRVRIGDDVWLRSAQANIQLLGDLTVTKDRKIYGLTGTLNAPRGSYTLQVGPINRDFSVDQGTVQYFGDPDLNADLNIQAHNQVRTLDGDEFNVVATITGSIREPKVSLTSPGRDLSQRDLVSYVLFGRSDFQLSGSQQGGTDAVGSALTVISGVVSSEVQRSLLNSGIGLSTLTIRPGATAGAVTSGSSVTQLAAGLQLGRRWFVTFDAGVCLTAQASSFQKRNFGASLEYRISREFRFQAAAEPVQSCISNRAADVFTTLNRYQLGGDLLWQRDY